MELTCGSPEAFSLDRCPREVWVRAGERTRSRRVSLGDVTALVESRNDRAENAWGLGWWLPIQNDLIDEAYSRISATLYECLYRERNLKSQFTLTGFCHRLSLKLGFSVLRDLGGCQFSRTFAMHTYPRSESLTFIFTTNEKRQRWPVHVGESVFSAAKISFSLFFTHGIQCPEA